MAELDEIRPRLEATWSAYFAVRVEYEDSLQFLAQYHKRKIVTDDEYAKYRIRNIDSKKELNDALKEYRKNRRERHGAETGRN